MGKFSITKTIARFSEAGVRPGKFVQTKVFSKRTEEAVSKVLPPSYDIKSYCGLICKVASMPKDGIVKLTISNGSHTFEWPVDCLSKGYGIVTK